MSGYQVPSWYPSVFGNSAQPQQSWTNPQGFNYSYGSGVGAAPIPAPAPPVAPAAPSGAGSGLIPYGSSPGTRINATGAPTGVAGAMETQAPWQTKPFAQWTGADYADYQKANQPNQGPGIANTVIQGIGTAANLGMGIYSLAKADEAFQWQKGMANDNYWNSVKSYNTAVSDRIKSRYTDEQYAANKDSIDAEIKKREMNGKGK